MNCAERLSELKSIDGTRQRAWSKVITLQNESYSEVYPSLFLGDYVISRNPTRLEELGVTHVVNCACGTEFNMVNTNEDYFHKSGIAFHGIPARDTWKFQLAPYFDDAVDFIDSALNSGGKVYVHCMSGVSRSSTIVLAFLILKRGMGLMKAVQTVRQKRKIMPNDGFLKELVELNQKIFSKG